MKKEFYFIAGIDISKQTFDVTVSANHRDAKSHYRNFSNNPSGIKKFIKWLNALGFQLCDTLFCMENTGIYHRLLAATLGSKNAFVWICPGAQIKWSMGIQRGKNDKMDSLKIMNYAMRNLADAENFIQRTENLDQIADLLTVRRRLIDFSKALKVPVKELKSAHLIKQALTVEESTEQTLNAVVDDLKGIENKIKALIKADMELKEVYTFATSVKSIGFIAACNMMVYTNCFKRFKSSKQIASYAGIAPFEYSSGTSIKGRTRVNHMANKNLKTILHMCAISAIANNEEMKIYYERKVKEGKNKMLVINAIRNKLLSRVFSCVKNKKMYIPQIAA